jgi:two-component system nitrate/nitrite response regulator NarL
MALLRDLSAFGMVTPVMMTAPVADLDLAIEAMRLGAVDLLICPIALVDAIERVSEAVKKGRRSRLLQEARLRVLELAETAEALEAEFVSNPASGLRPRSGPLNEDPLSALEPSLLSRLTPRERDVTRRLAQGLSVSQMARELELSPNTVRNHVKSIFNKLQVRSQVALLSLLIGARSGSVKSPV